VLDLDTKDLDQHRQSKKCGVDHLRSIFIDGEIFVEKIDRCRVRVFSLEAHGDRA
jgi:hypothetical protein